ncbi:MAG: hypothetical protein HYX93_02140 [Chloroflexi bacterium]|nr:hypothetical protein [Chloroflexota bacterium]
MAFLVALVLALVSVAVLAWPLVRRKPASVARTPVMDALEAALWREQQTFDEIKTLVLDFELGNIPGPEYEEKLNGHRMRAAYALRERERLQLSLAQLEDEVEDEVLRLRRSSGTVGEVTPCKGCGGQVDVEALRCPRCGLDRGGSASVEEGVSWAQQ